MFELNQVQNLRLQFIPGAELKQRLPTKLNAFQTEQISSQLSIVKKSLYLYQVEYE